MKSIRLLSIGLLIVLLAVVTIVILERRHTAQGRPDSANRVVLANGTTVLLYPVAEADRIVIVSFYRVGFLDEPKGMTQAAHLLEHLACQGATRSYQSGEAMRLLSQKGMANAETLSDVTYFDFVLPSRDLELALRIIGERLTSLSFTSELIRQEARNIYQETDSVERNPQAGMFKHAFMAFNQAWRYGATEALVRGGLEDIPLADLERFRRASYHPENSVLVLIGQFQRGRAIELLNKHLGAIQPSDAAPPQPVSWAQVPKQITVRWDSTLRAVCIGFPPPDDPNERVLLTLWGNVLMQRLATDNGIQQQADAVFCTNQLWSVGKLPFFVYAVPKPNVSTSHLRGLLETRVQEMAANKPTESEMTQLRLMADDLGQKPPLEWDFFRQQAQALAAQLGQDPEQAAVMVMGHIGLQLGVREVFSLDSAAAARALKALTADNLHGVVRRTLDPSRQFVTILTPMASVP